jgi:hypothetical protein
MLAGVVSVDRLSLFRAAENSSELLHLEGVYPRNPTTPRSWMDIEALLGRVGRSNLTYLTLAHHSQ